MSKIAIKFVKGGSNFCAETEFDNLNVNDCLVVESDRGLELAYISSLEFNGECEECYKVIRLANDSDVKKMDNLKKNIPHVMDITNKLIEKYSLEMKLVDVNYTLDGSKVIISYICEDRVDFRELVKDLAYELKLRIELRQIGVRDQAKILGGIGLCGKECCCKQYLNDFDKVSVKMAKVQGLSLNPTKISGLCGRLMCCLAYENETYAEIATKMPKLNTKVKTKDGTGVVVYNNILKQLVSVKIDNNGDIKINDYELSEIEKIIVDNNSTQKTAKVEKTEKIDNVGKKEFIDKSQEDKVIEQSIDNKQQEKKFDGKKNFHKRKKKFNNGKKNTAKD